MAFRVAFRLLPLLVDLSVVPVAGTSQITLSVHGTFSFSDASIVSRQFFQWDF